MPCTQAEQAALDSSTPPAHAHTHTLGACPAWSPRSLRAFVGVSGAFDLRALAEHLHRRGLYKELYERVMSINAIDAYGVQQRRHGEVEPPAEAEAEERARQHGAEGEAGGGGPGGSGGEVQVDCENQGAAEGGEREWEEEKACGEERGCGEPQGSEGGVPAGEEQQHETEVVVDGGVEVQEGEPPGEQALEKGKVVSEEKQQQQQQPYQAYIRASSAGGSSDGRTGRADDVAAGEGRTSAAAAARGDAGRSSSKGRARGSSKAKAREAKAKAKKSAQPQPAYELLSPLEAARRLPPGSGRDWLPAFTLIHGTKDKTVPYEGSVLLHRALEVG